jgi:hypothetical protein
MSRANLPGQEYTRASWPHPPALWPSPRAFPGADPNDLFDYILESVLVVLVHNEIGLVVADLRAIGRVGLVVINGSQCFHTSVLSRRRALRGLLEVLSSIFRVIRRLAMPQPAITSCRGNHVLRISGQHVLPTLVVKEAVQSCKPERQPPHHSHLHSCIGSRQVPRGFTTALARAYSFRDRKLSAGIIECRTPPSTGANPTFL